MIQAETFQQRVERVDASLAEWRQRSAYVLLCSDGRAKALPPGQLHTALAYVRDVDPKAQLIELCDPQARERFIAWAIAPKRGKAN